MLVQLTLKNFKIFKEETLLDCIPGPINEHKASLIKDPLDGEQFLPVIAIHGPNGGGKSTVLYGLQYLTGLLMSARPDTIAAQPIHHRMSPGNEDKPSEFDVLYRQGGFLFRYQLHLLRGMITEETLFYGRIGEEDAGILFNRKEADFHLGKAVTACPVKHVSPAEPLLSLLARSSQSEFIQGAFSWFESVHFLSSHSIPLPENAPDHEDKICSLLQAMDLDITGIKFTPQVHHSSAGMWLTHTPKGSAPYGLAYEDESEGTKKLLSILPHILSSLEQGSLIAADDLDSLLHPHLLRYIISLFTNSEKNPHGSQLMFTSHNTANLLPPILRRDEIWLCCHGSGEENQLYPLSWYKKENGLIPRNDEAYGKQYLEGRYGAIPMITT